MQSFSAISLQKQRVSLLKREALRSNLIFYKQKWSWLEEKVLACNGDERSLEDLRELIRRLPWSLNPEAVDVIVEDNTKRKSLAKAFDAVVDSVAAVTELIKKS